MKLYPLLGTNIRSDSVLRLSALSQEDEWTELVALLRAARIEWLEQVLNGESVDSVKGKCELLDDLLQLKDTLMSISDEIMFDERGHSGTNAGPASM